MTDREFAKQLLLQTRSHDELAHSMTVDELLADITEMHNWCIGTGCASLIAAADIIKCSLVDDVSAKDFCPDDALESYRSHLAAALLTLVNLYFLD